MSKFNPLNPEELYNIDDQIQYISNPSAQTSPYQNIMYHHPINISSHATSKSQVNNLKSHHCCCKGKKK